MMHTVVGGQPAGNLPFLYSHDAVLEDLSRQIALSQASRRTSRSSNGHRSGNAMRVSKPNSTNNSPRSSAMMGRRKTLINDGNAQWRRQQAMEQQPSLYHGLDKQQQQTVGRASRPVSWHPGTCGFPQSQQPSMTFSTANMYSDSQDIYACYPHLSPMLGSHSANTSPLSAFSPAPLPPRQDESIQYFPHQHASGTSHLTAAYPPTSAPQYTTQAYRVPDEPPVGSLPQNGSWDWNSFIMHGFNATSPPTPEAFPPAQHSQPAVTEESIPFEALDEPTEEEGEILVGMGLYDTPEKHDNDPHLDNYRSTVSSLLGSPFRRFEPQGKGLKLEETWEPPKSDDEEEDDDEDAEEEDDENEEK